MTRLEAIAGKEKLDQLMRDMDEQTNALQALVIHLEQMRGDLIYARQQYNRVTEGLRRGDMTAQ
jgi:hypothetical protein